MMDEDDIDSVSRLLESIAGARATMDTLKSVEAKSILRDATQKAATYLPAARTGSVSPLKTVPKERPL